MWVGLAGGEGCCIVQGTTGACHVGGATQAAPLPGGCRGGGACARRSGGAWHMGGLGGRSGHPQVIQRRPCQAGGPHPWAIDRSTRSSASMVMMLLPRITCGRVAGQSGSSRGMRWRPRPRVSGSQPPETYFTPQAMQGQACGARRGAHLTAGAQGAEPTGGGRIKRAGVQTPQHTPRRIPGSRAPQKV